jgi:phospholipid-binding lipoprotein MlaA
MTGAERIQRLNRDGRQDRRQKRNRAHFNPADRPVAESSKGATIRTVIVYLTAILIFSALSKGVSAEVLSSSQENVATGQDRAMEGAATSQAETAARSDEDYAENFDGEEEDEFVYILDPFEPLNRAAFWFNDKFYFLLLKPAARAYRVVPEPARISAANFFTNLTAPIRLVNSLLQLKLKDAGNELARFVINTTVGIGGLFDPARKWADIRMKDEDFGQTMYMVLPFFGPTNTRDGIGDIVDYFLDPTAYIDDIYLYLSMKSLAGVNATSLDPDTYESIKKQSLDPYIFIRNAFTQRRKGLVKK